MKPYETLFHESQRRGQERDDARRWSVARKALLREYRRRIAGASQAVAEMGERQLRQIRTLHQERDEALVQVEALRGAAIEMGNALGHEFKADMREGTTAYPGPLMDAADDLIAALALTPSTALAEMEVRVGADATMTERARCLNAISSYVVTARVLPHSATGLALQAIMGIIHPIREADDD